MPNKLQLDSLSAEIYSVEGLLQLAVESNDLVGKLQFQHRLESLNEERNQITADTVSNNMASVAIFFGGKPVLGSKGIAAEFAGKALEQFQDLVSKTFAKNEVGSLGTRGRIPLKPSSQLMVTGLVKGSFGFVLDEINSQSELVETALSETIDETAQILSGTGNSNDKSFELIAAELDKRTLDALRKLFNTLDSNEATIRIVEGQRDFTLDTDSIRRGKLRTEETSIEEDEIVYNGILVGFLPEHKKFEIGLEDGHIIYGSVSKEATEQFKQATSESRYTVGKQCKVAIQQRTIKPRNSPDRETLRLIAFLDQGDAGQ